MRVRSIGVNTGELYFTEYTLYLASSEVEAAGIAGVVFTTTPFFIMASMAALPIAGGLEGAGAATPLEAGLLVAAGADPTITAAGPAFAVI